MEKKVQLKEQEIVGQEVVLSDIYPKTDTTSVEDPVTGASLDVKLDYLVEMINDKLTRVVNSVNNRTGVVVLDASDVGLGNVDNVSYAEIKEWTDDAIVQMFANKRLILADTQASLDDWMENHNDPIYDNVLFYIQSIDENNEYRGMIGYLKYDTNNDALYISGHKAINTVGETDQSLIYQNGKLEVGISAILANVLYNADDGLSVDWNTTGHLLYTFNSIYDFSNLNNALDGLLLTDDHYGDESAPNIYVRINDRNVINKTTGQSLFKLNYDSISNIAGFKLLEDGISSAYIIITNSENDIAQIENIDSLSITPELIHHNTLVGILSHSSNTGNWMLRLIAIKQAASWGLTTDSVYQTPNTIRHINDSILRVDTIGDTSGIQALSKPTQYDIANVANDGNYNKSIPNSQMNWKFTPEGIHTIYTTASTRQGGLFIPTDASLMTYSYDEYGLKPELKNASTELSSSRIDNWFANTPYHLDQTQLESHEGYLNKPTFIGINLVKWKNEVEDGGDTAITLIPISGLKVIDAYDANKHGALTWADLGLDETVDSERLLKDANVSSPFDLPFTGGLMVNVGKGLEIMPTAVPEHGEDFNTQGKVNVRIGNGLTFDDYGRIEIADSAFGADTSFDRIIEFQYGDGSYQYLNEIVNNPNRHQIMHEDQLLDGSETKTIFRLGDGLRLKYIEEDFPQLLLFQFTMSQLRNSGIFDENHVLDDMTFVDLKTRIATLYHSTDGLDYDKLVSDSKSILYKNDYVENFVSYGMLLHLGARLGKTATELSIGLTTSDLETLYVTKYPDYEGKIKPA